MHCVIERRERLKDSPNRVIQLGVIVAEQLTIDKRLTPVDTFANLAKTESELPMQKHHRARRRPLVQDDDGAHRLRVSESGHARGSLTQPQSMNASRRR